MLVLENVWSLIIIQLLFVLLMSTYTEASSATQVTAYNASPVVMTNKPTHLCVLAHGYVSKHAGPLFVMCRGEG